MEMKTMTDASGVEHILIYSDENTFSFMLKSTYEAMQAEQSTPNLS
jgi:translation elongation factor P/translation initiation factor 5A